MQVQKFGLQTGCGFILKHTLIKYLEKSGSDRLVATKIHVLNKQILFSKHCQKIMKGGSFSPYIQFLSVISQECSPLNG